VATIAFALPANPAGTRLGTAAWRAGWTIALIIASTKRTGTISHTDGTNQREGDEDSGTKQLQRHQERAPREPIRDATKGAAHHYRAEGLGDKTKSHSARLTGRRVDGD